MSYGKMNVPIYIVSVVHGKDADGFSAETETIVACFRAYKEDKNSSEKWANLSSFSDVTALFRFRYLPNIEISTDMQISCFDGKYNILSIENVRGRNMYYEVMAKLICN